VIEPLREPAVLLSENCPECRGTGQMYEPHRNSWPCGRCDGAGREVREVPLSEVWEMAQASHAAVIAPPPSMTREEMR
jgi:DnaJ-class molecular chaperone